MKKAVLKIELHDSEAKDKAMKTVSGLPGVGSITMDMKNMKLTVIGDIEPVTIVSKLKELCQTTELLSVGPAKEPEKKQDEPKKDETKKDDGKKKKDEPKKDDGKQKKDNPKKDDVAERVSVGSSKKPDKKKDEPKKVEPKKDR